MVATWPNVQTIRLAIESESKFSGISATEAAAVILEAARERIPITNPFCPEWAAREISRLNQVDRFWFEDARWRGKDTYQRFVAELRESA